MAEYTLRVRRYQPESGEGAFWEEFNVDLDPSLSVLDGILQAKRPRGRLAQCALLLPRRDLRLLRDEDQRPVRPRLQDADRRGLRAGQPAQRRLGADRR